MSHNHRDYDDWAQTDLGCARCSLHWQGLYSKKYKAAHPLGRLIQCPECRSRFGVHPASPVTETTHTMKAFPPRDLKDWPKSPDGRYLCNDEHPMPNDAPGRWGHSNTIEVGEQRPGWPAGDMVTRQCVNCGLQWEEELPQ